MVNLINRLDDRKFEYVICWISRSGTVAECLTRHIPILGLGNKGMGKDYLLPLRLALLIKREKPDLVHSRNWSAIDSILAARMASVRHVVCEEHVSPTGRKKIRKTPNPLHLVSQFIVASADLKNWLVQQAPPSVAGET